MKFNGMECLSKIEANMLALLDSAKNRINEIESEDYYIGTASFFFRSTSTGRTKLMRVIGKSVKGKRENVYIGKHGHNEALHKLNLGDELQLLNKRKSELEEIIRNYNHRLRIVHSDFKRFERELTHIDETKKV